MEDFATFCKKKEHIKVTELQNSVTIQTGFVASRLNKDNFWNIIFSLLFFLSLAIGYIMPQPIGVIFALFVFASAVIIVKVKSPLTFDKENMEFTTSLGKKTKHIGLGFLFLVAISFVISCHVIGNISSALNIENTILDKVLFSFSTAFLPVLYCILRNLPISVYFKKRAWVGYSSRNAIFSESNSYSSKFSTTRQRSIITDPSYRYLSCNVYHKR